MNSICKIKITGYVFNFLRITITLSILFLLLSNCGQNKQKYKNPYNVLNKWYETISDITKDSSLVIHYYGYFSAADFDQPCNIERWYQSAKYYKYMILCKDYEYIHCDNGELSWSITNGKLSIDNDSSTANDRKVSGLLIQAEFLNKNSKIFSLKYSGMVNHRDYICYVVDISNSLNEDIQTYIIDTANYYRVTELIKKDDITTTIEYYDFRKVDNTIFPFKLIMNYSDRDETPIIYFDSIKIEEALPDSFYNINENH